MRHGKKIYKLQRRKSHREALMNNLCKSLIEHRRIRTTVAKAKALRPMADRLVTLGKQALNPPGKNEQEKKARIVHLNRQAFAKLQSRALVFKLFHEIAPASKDRQGGYTRITKLGQRHSDSAPMAFIEWVDAFVPKRETPEAAEPEAAKEPVAEPKAGKKAGETKEGKETKPRKKKAAAKGD